MMRQGWTYAGNTRLAQRDGLYRSRLTNKDNSHILHPGLQQRSCFASRSWYSESAPLGLTLLIPGRRRIPKQASVMSRCASHQGGEFIDRWGNPCS